MPAPSTKRVIFPECTEEIQNSCADLQEASEYGAHAIAVAALAEFFDLKMTRRIAKDGKGCDFFVSKYNSKGANFLDGDRCEISGILENKKPNELSTRIKDKWKRLERYNTIGKVYIVVADFRYNKCKVVEYDKQP